MSSYKKDVPLRGTVNAESVIVAQCGAWIAWANGSPADKTRRILPRGCQVSRLALLADQSFVCWMSASLKDDRLKDHISVS